METFAYCLMCNHYHFLVRIKPITADIRQKIAAENTVASKHFLDNQISLDIFLEDQFKRLFSSYALSFNKQQQRRGSLFQESFKRVQLRNEVRLLDALCYIHHNPIHHNLSPFYDVWQYSSYVSYLSNKPTLLARTVGLALFDNLGLDYKAFVQYHEAYRLEKEAWKKSIDWDDSLLLDNSKDPKDYVK